MAAAGQEINQPPAAPAPQFALAPTLHPQNGGFINYGTKEGQKLFEIAAAPLGLENKFDGKDSEIIVFKQALQERADFAGWTQGNSDIIDIPTGVEGQANQNLIEKYGVITDTMIRTWATANIVNQETRRAQNNFTMYKCLSDSISENLKNKLVTNGIDCTINGTKVAALLFKAIMNESEINTVATISTIQLLLSRLHEVINSDEINGDISKFNKLVKQKIQDLTCRGASYSGLVLNLLLAYRNVSDSDFVAFITLKETAFLHGELDLTYEKLMLIAETDYKIRVEKGTWGQLSAEQQQIVALSAELKKFKKNKSPASNANKDKDNEDTNKGKSNKQKKGKKSKQKKDNDSKWAWKKVPPANGETTKDFESKTYYFCPKHKAWTLHKPSECRLGEITRNTNSDSNKNDASNSNVTFASALATIEAESQE